MSMRCSLAILILLAYSSRVGLGDEPRNTSQGDTLVAQYFRLESRKLTDDCLSRIRTADDWAAQRGEIRRELLDMLGLDPLPERTPLEPVVTGRLEHDDFVVENLHFQSSPGLYVTGNLYLPRHPAGKLPAVLYVCGHSGVKKNGVSYGNKVAYQHHGIWFARNGYACLVIDTLQLGEIEGIHHGLYNQNMWWWLARGYTPAGVEAWNCLRALDYLESRPEVDASRLGVTGRSGGGAYSWWITAIDDRIQAAVPVAGITSLWNHVVDGCIEGHCDCMYMCNTYRWDFPEVAALVAPRPLLISNTDKDSIFPLDGVVDLHAKTRRIYELLGATEKLGLQITEGPHKDTQELQVHAFVWMNRYLQGQNGPIDSRTESPFQPEELKVFQELPTGSINARIHDVFVPPAVVPPPPADRDEWNSQCDRWTQALRNRVFRGWPDDPASLAALELHEVSKARAGGLELAQYELSTQPPYRPRLHVLTNDAPAGQGGKPPGRVTLTVLDQAAWEEIVPRLEAALAKLQSAKTSGAAPLEALDLPIPAPGSSIAWMAPRGVGETEWTRDERQRTQIRRRFALLGQTDDGMRVFDVRCALQAVRSLAGNSQREVVLAGTGPAATWALYASLFEPPVRALLLTRLEPSHACEPILLNILRVLDVPQAVAMAATRGPVVLEAVADQPDPVASYVEQVEQALGEGALRFSTAGPAAGRVPGGD